MRFKRLQAASIGGALASALICGAFSSSASAQNILTDPGFENQTAAPNPNPSNIAGWSTFNGAAFLSTPAAHSGSWVMDAPAGGGGFTVPGAYESFNATPGQTFTLSGFVYTPSTLVTGDNDFAILQLSWFTGAAPLASNIGGNGTAGVDIGDPAGTPPAGTVALPEGTWEFASVTGTAPAGTNSMGAFLLGINADTNGTFYFDDMTLTETAVPEPASLGLLGLGSLMVLKRRRRA